MALVPLLLLSLVLVNAQAVTSLTSERDARALELLLVTDLTPVEIVFGKLGGVFYNTKEMVLLPLLLVGYLWIGGALSLENLLYLAGGLAVLYLFVAVLGIHAGMIYGNSRTAIAVSLGTVFFLFLGVATCIRMMVAFSGSFQSQLAPFLAFMLGGGLGMYVALGVRNPSTAIGVAAFLCPIATFYAITSFFLNYTLAVFLVGAAAYGFTTAAMLIPAIYEFDVATGRTTIGEQ
jgi:ABC-type Na+ efflux pump permease subunit